MHNSGIEPDPFNISTLCLYGMIASSTLLMTYIAVFFAFQVDLWARLLETWKRVQGQPTGEKRHLLHTLPYYLAITRSTCEVSSLHNFAYICSGICVLIWSVNFQYETQAHILNLPVGNSIPIAAKNSVKLDGVKLKLGNEQARWKSMVGRPSGLQSRGPNSRTYILILVSDDKCGTPWASSNPHPCFPRSLSCNQHISCRLKW